MRKTTLLLLFCAAFACSSGDDGNPGDLESGEMAADGLDTGEQPDGVESDDFGTADAEDSGSDTSGGNDAEEPGDQAVDPDSTDDLEIPFGCNSPTILDGWNKDWTVAGVKRSFYIKFPSQLGVKPLGVIFVYHGFGDSVDNFKYFFNPDQNANPDFPYLVVFPKSMALNPLNEADGIEWSVFKSKPGDNNPDALFFEEILGCINKATDIDTKAIFAFGFSAGAIFTNMLHDRYPKIISSVLSMSGAWFSEPSTVAGVNTMGMATLSWSAMEKGQGTVFMTHGGAQDIYSILNMKIIDFELSASYAIDYLTGLGRTVIDCPHTSGHTNHPNISIADMVQFFTDHRTGGVSPYVTSGLPEWLPPGCTLYPAE